MTQFVFVFCNIEKTTIDEEEEELRKVHNTINEP